MDHAYDHPVSLDKIVLPVVSLVKKRKPLLPAKWVMRLSAWKSLISAFPSGFPKASAKQMLQTATSRLRRVETHFNSF